jgi:hypothetical protein
MRRIWYLLIILSSLCLQGLAECRFDIIHRDQIYSEAFNNELFSRMGFYVTHDMYSLVDREWVEKKFLPKWQARKEQTGLTFKLNTTTCETFSFLARCMAVEMDEIIVSVGVFFYRQDTARPEDHGHAINIVFIKREDFLGGGVEVLFFDPQTGREVSLTRRERDSCYLIYF